MTYGVNGVQYVAVMAAWGGGFPYVPRYSAAYKRGNRGESSRSAGWGRRALPPELPSLELHHRRRAEGGNYGGHRARPTLLFGNCVLCHSNSIVDHAGPARMRPT